MSITDVASEAFIQAARRRRLVIRHATGDRIVAIVAIVSPGNKANQKMLEAFVEQALGALNAGYHLLMLDLFPPSRFDPAGMHGAIWSQWGDNDYEVPPDKPLTLAAYEAGEIPTTYVEPIAVGMPLPDMPLFLDPGHYVNVPLESTYMEAWDGVPTRWKRVIEGA